MYLAGVARGARLTGPALRRVATGNVIALGLVSLFTDISSEMVTAVLPAYLVLGLHLSMAQYGALDGLYTGATAFTRLLGGYLADRFRQRKLVAFIGYAMSAVAKVGLLFTGNAPAAVGAVIAADRTGKGIRTAPRDALIALSVEERDLGQAFGLHRAMDSFGAFLGPLAALGLLGLAATDAYDAVFVGSLCAAAIGLLVMVAVRPQSPGPGCAGDDPCRSGSGRCCSAGAFRRLCAVAALLGLVTVGDGFVYLVLADRDDLPVAAFPLLAVGTSLTFVLLALPLGRLADRVGRWPIVVGRLRLPARGLSDPQPRPRPDRARRAALRGVLCRDRRGPRCAGRTADPGRAEDHRAGAAADRAGSGLLRLLGDLRRALAVRRGRGRLSRGGDRRRADPAGERTPAATGQNRGSDMKVKIISTVLAAALLISIAVIWALTRRQPELESDPELAVGSAGTLVRDTRTGQLAIVAPDGTRRASKAICARAYAAAGRIACLRWDPQATTAFQLSVLDEHFNPIRTLPINGVPTRTRVSADGRMLAFTVFVAGDSYLSSGFSTRSGILDLGTGDAGQLAGGLHHRRQEAADRRQLLGGQFRRR